MSITHVLGFLSFFYRIFALFCIGQIASSYVAVSLFLESVEFCNKIYLMD